MHLRFGAILLPHPHGFRSHFGGRTTYCSTRFMRAELGVCPGAFLTCP